MPSIYDNYPKEQINLKLGNLLDELQDVQHLCTLGYIGLDEKSLGILENAEKVIADLVDLKSYNEQRVKEG